MNNVVLIGRLTKDPELRYTPGQTNTAVATFTLAVNKKLSKKKKQDLERQGKPTADFIRCQAWGRMAENIANYIKKGQQLAIQGRIQTGSYQHKDGYTVYTTDVIVETADFIDWGEPQANQGYYQPQPGYQGQGAYYPPQQAYQPPQGYQTPRDIGQQGVIDHGHLDFME